MRSGFGATGLVTRREDACVWVGGVDNAAVSVVPGWVTVIVEPGVADWAGLAEVLSVSPAPANGWVVLVAGAGGPAGFGARLATRLDVPVVAPGGDVLRAADGSLFAVGGEFWLCPPGRPANAVGPRWPVPAWHRALDAVPAHTAMCPVPAGLHLAGSGDPPAPTLSGIQFAVPPDPRILRLMLDPSVPARTVVAALDALAGTEVELVPLGTGLRAGHAVARAAADALESPVRLHNGVPLRTPDRGDAVFVRDGAGVPVWEQPARLLEFRPGHGPVVVRAGLGQSGLRPVGHVGFALTERRVVRVTASGLVVTRAGAPVRPAPVRSPDVDFEIVVGTSGDIIEDELWPVLAALLARVLVDLPGQARLIVAGEVSAWGDTAAQELAGRHGVELAMADA